MCKGDSEGDNKRRLRNCDSDENPNIAWEWMPGLRRCPWSQLTDEVWVAYSWWQDWKSMGALPWGGNDLMEQPAYVVEVIRRCEGVLQTVESEAHENHQKEMARTQRKAKRNG